MTSGLGGFRGTVKGLVPSEVVALVASYLGEAQVRDFGTEWYRESATVGPSGSLVGWHSRAGSDEVFVDVRQTDCDALGYVGALQLLGVLVGLGFRPSRLDVYVDDYELKVTPRQMVAAFDAGQIVSRVRERELHDGGRKGDKATFGARSSELYYRVYDKRDMAATREDPQGRAGGPSAGVTRRYRHEIEAKGARTAPALARALLVEGAEPARVMWSHLTGVLDFRDRAQGQAHGERAARLPWWSELVEGAERVRVAARVKVDYLAKRAAWVRQSVARVLASTFAGYGSGWLNEVLEEGMDRLTPRDRAMVGAVRT